MHSGLEDQSRMMVMMMVSPNLFYLEYEFLLCGRVL